MRKRKAIVTLMLAIGLFLSLLPARAAEEKDFPTVLAEAKRGVVQIYGLAGSGNRTESWLGSGFAVGEKGKNSDVFLTNWHVVTGNGEYDISKVRVWILQENCTFNEQTGEPDSDKSITCEVLKTTTGYPDYAIIRATEKVEGYQSLPLLPSEKVPDGTTVYALGYPAIVGDMSSSHFGINDITSTDGIVSQHMQMVDAGNSWVLMHTAKISGGNSGGPLITKDGAVVGLNTYAFGETEITADRFCAVYIDYAIEGLDELKLPYEAFADEKEQTTKPENDQEPAEHTDSEEDSQVFFWIYCGAGVAVVAAVVLLIVLKRKQRQLEEQRHREEERHQEQLRQQQEEQLRRQMQEKREQQARQEMGRKIVLRTASGREISMVSGGTIGRDPGCAIVLPEKAPGVSRIHCRLELQGEQLILMDLGSSYGTYIHRKRIPANTPVALKTGSSFSLGSEQYTFTVC